MDLYWVMYDSRVYEKQKGLDRIWSQLFHVFQIFQQKKRLEDANPIASMYGILTYTFTINFNHSCRYSKYTSPGWYPDSSDTKKPSEKTTGITFTVKEGSSQWLGQSPWKRTWHAGHRHRRPRFCWRFVSGNFFWGCFFGCLTMFCFGVGFSFFNWSFVDVCCICHIYRWFLEIRFFRIHRVPRLYKGIDQRLPTYSDWLRILREIFLRQSSHVTCNIL